MSCFKAECEFAVWRAVEGNAEFDEIADAGRAFFGDQTGDGWVDEACASRDSIRGVLFWAIFWVEGGCKTALRPR